MLAHLSMQLALIDSATISQLVQFLDCGTRRQYRWSIQEAIDLTALAMRERNLTIAPGLAGPKGMATDPLDRMIDGMLRGGIIRLHDVVSDEDRLQALSKSKCWIGRSHIIEQVHNEVERLHADSEKLIGICFSSGPDDGWPGVFRQEDSRAKSEWG
jgi:hypothetical protein